MIQVFVNGQFACNDLRASTEKEAVRNYFRKYPGVEGKVSAQFAKQEEHRNSHRKSRRSYDDWDCT